MTKLNRKKLVGHPNLNIFEVEYEKSCDILRDIDIKETFACFFQRKTNPKFKILNTVLKTGKNDSDMKYMNYWHIHNPEETDGFVFNGQELTIEVPACQNMFDRLKMAFGRIVTVGFTIATMKNGCFARNVISQLFPGIRERFTDHHTVILTGSLVDLHNNNNNKSSPIHLNTKQRKYAHYFSKKVCGQKIVGPAGGTKASSNGNETIAIVNITTNVYPKDEGEEDNDIFCNALSANKNNQRKKNRKNNNNNNNNNNSNYNNRNINEYDDY